MYESALRERERERERAREERSGKACRLSRAARSSRAERGSPASQSRLSQNRWTVRTGLGRLCARARPSLHSLERTSRPLHALQTALHRSTLLRCIEPPLPSCRAVGAWRAACESRPDEVEERARAGGEGGSCGRGADPGAEPRARRRVGQSQSIDRDHSASRLSCGERERVGVEGGEEGGDKAEGDEAAVRAVMGRLLMMLRCSRLVLACRKAALRQSKSAERARGAEERWGRARPPPANSVQLVLACTAVSACYSYTAAPSTPHQPPRRRLVTLSSSPTPLAPHRLILVRYKQP